MNHFSALFHEPIFFVKIPNYESFLVYLKTLKIFNLIEKQLLAMVLIPLGWGVKSLLFLIF